MHLSRFSVFTVACLLIIAGILAISCGDDDKVNNPVTTTSLPGAWAPVGTGIGLGDLGEGFVLHVSGDSLILGGNFDSVDSVTAHNIAVWQGSAWGPLGTGVTGGAVMALTDFIGYMIVGGAFDHAGAVSADHIAFTDGSSWGAIGPGRGTDVHALAVYQTALFMGGVNGVDGGLGMMSGMSWLTLAEDMYVRAFTIYNDTLIIGGSFDNIGNDSGDNIIAFTGMNGVSLGTGINGNVHALTVFDGKLIAGGSFSSAGGVEVSNIAAWDGSSWTPLGSGINGIVCGLTIWDNRLIACGQFSTAGGKSAMCIAAWDGSSWKSLGSGMNATVYAVTPYGIKLIACGNFTTAGGVSARGIAAWSPK